MIIKVIFSIIIGYTFGCFETAYFVGKIFKGVDIRNYGSKNAGASNVTTTLGWKYGVITAIGDIVKAIIPIIIINYMYSENLLSFITGISAIIGHIFPFYLGFKGGKGIASLIGMSLIFDFRIGLVMMLSIIIITIIFNYIALGSIFLYTILPMLLYYFDYENSIVYLSIVITFIGYYKHISNIKNILNGKETGLRDAIKKKKFDL